MDFKVFTKSGRIIEKTEPCNLLPWEERTIEEIATGISERYPGDLVLIEVTVCDRR
ncbi:MAG: hypothetical protein LUC94_13100 [Clostridiales bacterium]|nr:hypothetical protein [Clostridiales bacterium]